MSFPNNVRTNVLVKCKRYCCLCGKYVGNNIELHHIIQRADRGDDTEDNCIPLCFNCHAEVKSYNPHHPKGSKYSEKELKERRNLVYEFVKDKTICNYSNDDINRATKLLNNYYKQIEQIISTDPCAEPVHIDLNAFANEMLLNLQSYAFEFSDEAVDRQKCYLIEALQEWYNIMSNEEYFHIINSYFLCFNSNSVNSYREAMGNIRTQIRDSYLFLKTVALNRVR